MAQRMSGKCRGAVARLERALLQLGAVSVCIACGSEPGPHEVTSFGIQDSPSPASPSPGSPAPLSPSPFGAPLEDAPEPTSAPGATETNFFVIPKVCNTDADCPTGQRCAVIAPDAAPGAGVDEAPVVADGGAAAQSRDAGLAADGGADAGEVWAGRCMRTPG